MKTYFTVFILSIVFLFACKNDEKSGTSTETVQTKDSPVATRPDTTRTLPAPDVIDTSCIAGIYILNIQTAVINSPIRIVLNPDGTGEDNFSGSKIPITWTLKDGKIKLYSAKNKKGTAVEINCKSGELMAFGKTFGKNNPLR